MPLPALLIGDPDRLSFQGHLRLSLDRGAAGISVAARVGVSDDPVPAWWAARALQTRLSTALGEADPDRHSLLHALWRAVADMPADALGPAAGGDLSLLATSWDPDAIAIAGVGLASVWAWRRAGLVPLVEAGHPLLAGPGRPARTPGVLTLDIGVVPDAIVGCPSHLDPTPPPPVELPRRCGLRDQSRSAR